MASPQNISLPHLVVLAPGPHQGQEVQVTENYMIVGREPTCAVQFDDPHVSRTHAALLRRGPAVYVEDLGSSGGTFVNGTPVNGAQELRPGDVVAFASVRSRYEPAGARGDETQTMSTAAARFRIDQQHGQVISNVGRDQHNSYSQQVIQQRESFLREIAATRTRARWLIWTGFFAFVVGFGLFAATDLSLISQIGNDIQSGSTEFPSHPFGREIAGIPAGLLGWALGALGMLLIIVGIVLHIVATSRRRRVDRELPVPPPWASPGQPGG